MKKNIIQLGAILAVSIIAISSPATTVADIVIAQDTNIDVQQNNTKKDGIDGIKKTEETEKNTSLKNSDSSNCITENSSEIVERESEIIKNKSENAENNVFNNPIVTEDNVLNETESTEDETILEEKTTEKSTEENVENVNNTASDVNVNIDNTNYFEINNNTGNVYVNIYNGIGVDINNNGKEETDVSVIVDNEINIAGNETLLETQESETAEEIKIIEGITEETTEAPKRSNHSSSGRRSSSSKRKNEVLNTGNTEVTEVKSVDTEDVKSEKEKKVVCMAIGNNLMNINGEAVETDSLPYISNSYTLVPLRCISTVFDAEVEWDKNTKTAIIKSDDTETRFTINSYKMFVNGRTVMIPKAAEIRNGRTYVPLRALGESLNANVSWIPDSKSVLIIK